MKRFVLLLLLFTVAGVHAQSDSPAETAAQASRAYAAGDFETAIVLYQSLVDGGMRDSAVYFNLATSYHQNARTGFALVNYRRAQRLAPRDLTITARIAEIQGERLDVQGEETVLLDRLGTAVAGVLTLGELALLSFVLWSGWFGGAILLVVRPSLRAPLRAVMIVFGVVAAATTALFASRWYVETYRPLAVVVAEQAEVLSGPGEDYLLLYELSEAAEMRVVRQQEQYARVVLPDGRLGWLSTEAIALAAIPSG